MARVLITGSTDGLGLLAARSLVDEGHEVTLHARSNERLADARRLFTGASQAVVGDLSSIKGCRHVAEQANAFARYDAIIHNAGVGFGESGRVVTVDGLSNIFAVNVLAPYLLTALINPPDRLIYLSSGMHRDGDSDLSDLQWVLRPWNSMQAYSDSKLFDTVLTFAVARRWPNVLSNAVEPGWVATKMGGPDAPDDLALGAVTQAWLAVSEDPGATVSGKYFFHQQLREVNSDANDISVQDGLLDACAELTGVELP